MLICKIKVYVSISSEGSRTMYFVNLENWGGYNIYRSFVSPHHSQPEDVMKTRGWTRIT